MITVTWISIFFSFAFSLFQIRNVYSLFNEMKHELQIDLANGSFISGLGRSVSGQVNSILGEIQVDWFWVSGRVSFIRSSYILRS